MNPIHLGKDTDTNKRIYLDPNLFRTHMHFVGATGTGKSTALMTLMQSIVSQAGLEKCCLFLIDPIGNLSHDLLRFIAHPTFCPQHVRDRLVYFEPANEDYVTPFNPLTYTTESQRYFQTMRTVDLVLRAWAAQDVTQQPRLLQWTYKAFCAAAMMGMPIAMCQHLLHPGTDLHQAILRQIPGDIQSHWSEILGARGSEAIRILESTRNRLDPFFESVNLRRMFGARQSRFDCERMIRERKIVILNLGQYGVIPGFIADTIGSLALNEIVATANRMSTNEGRHVVDPTYVVMDEFQKYVSVDIEDALPTVRQMGLRLMLAHQSFSQLEREEVDLTQMIWQARSRLMFANNARDADIIADELAKLTFDPMTVKDIRTSKRQLIVGYRKDWLESHNSTNTASTGSTSQNAIGYNQNRGQSAAPDAPLPTRTQSDGSSSNNTTGTTNTNTSGESHGRSQANVPIHDTFDEISNVTYENFEEFSLKWGKRLRRLKTGEAIVKIANEDDVREVLVDYLPIEPTKRLNERVEELLEKNYASDFFITAAEADREIEACRQQLLTGPTIHVPKLEDHDTGSDDESEGEFTLR